MIDDFRKAVYRRRELDPRHDEERQLVLTELAELRKLETALKRRRTACYKTLGDIDRVQFAKPPAG